MPQHRPLKITVEGEMFDDGICIPAVPQKWRMEEAPKMEEEEKTELATDIVARQRSSLEQPRRNGMEEATWQITAAISEEYLEKRLRGMHFGRSKRTLFKDIKVSASARHVPDDPDTLWERRAMRLAKRATEKRKKVELYINDTNNLLQQGEIANLWKNLKTDQLGSKFLCVCLSELNAPSSRDQVGRRCGRGGKDEAQKEHCSRADESMEAQDGEGYLLIGARRSNRPCSSSTVHEKETPATYHATQGASKRRAAKT